MSAAAIQVRNLWKQYKIGLNSSAAYNTLRERLTYAITAPIQLAKSRLIGEIKNQTRNYGTIWALKDLTINIIEGEVVGIIGRNGAGKSTLLKLLSRITEPTKGSIDLYGRVGSLLEVGTGFHHELTGRENIYLNGAILGMRRAEIEKKFKEIVDFSEIEQFLDTPVKFYSSGMYMRLAFSVAAHLEPEILLVDEVLAVGDASFQKKCLGKMGDVAKEGRTVIFVSHNMAAIEGLCSRVVVLNSGEMTFDGNTQDGIAYYLNSAMLSNGISIRERTDRQGIGEARFTNVRILDRAGNETQEIGMGDDFTIEVKSEGKLSKAIIGIIIGNLYRNQVVRGYTWEQLTREINLTGNDVICCSFDNLPLMHGNYDIHLWIGRPGECSDYIENATSLTIVPRDVFKTGRNLDPLGGIFYSKANWIINGESYE